MGRSAQRRDRLGDRTSCAVTSGCGEKTALPRVVEALSTMPARLAGIPGGSLKVGVPADIVIFETDEDRGLGSEPLHSKARNSPFVGFEGKGRVLYTFVAGKMMFGDLG